MFALRTTWLAHCMSQGCPQQTRPCRAPQALLWPWPMFCKVHPHPPFPKWQSGVLKRVWLLFQGAQAEKWQSAPGHGTRAGDPAAAHTAGLGEHLWALTVKWSMCFFFSYSTFSLRFCFSSYSKHHSGRSHCFPVVRSAEPAWFS